MGFFPLLAGLIAVPALAAGASLPRAASQYPTVNTTHGYVRGAGSEYRDGVTVYKGIPFAAPPTGSNRWKAPSSPTPWTDVLEATEFGPQCAQSISSAGIFSTGKNTTSEDCLYLNVWHPTSPSPSDLSSTSLPVYVWIYGGRFSGGSGDVKTYDGSGLASKDIVVVTLNYRLGAFGFLAHPDLSAEAGAHNASGNYGLLDQQAALRWVRDNIAQFGGNPDQVTVGGQSAGSASALDMMWSPLSRGLVHGVIAESGARGPHDPVTGGAATSYREKSAAEDAGVAFLQTMNVSSVDELRDVSMDALIAQGNGMDTTFVGTAFENVTAAFMEPPVWRPVVDGYVLPHGYGDALALGDHADIPVLTGNNRDESGASTTTAVSADDYKTDYGAMFRNFSSEFFSLYPGANETQASASSDALFRDISRVGTWQWSVDWAKGGAKSSVYTYYFTHAPPENEEAGAYHGAELWYAMNNIPYAAYDNATWSAEDYEIESKMAGYWANFIKTGDPNGGNLTRWEPSTEGKKETMWLGDKWGAGPISEQAERISFLESWLSTLHQW